MTKKTLIFSIILTSLTFLGFNKVFAVPCGNPDFPGICNSGTSCGSYDHEESQYNNQCPAGQHCCVPNCLDDGDCPACYSCENQGFLGWYGKACVIDDASLNKCSGACKFCNMGQCQNSGTCECETDEDCPACKICVYTGGGENLTGSTCNIFDGSNNKCTGPCQQCSNGTCSGCPGGQACHNDSNTCVQSCASKNGVCSDYCSSQFVISYNDDCDNSGQICCNSSSIINGNPCIDQGGICKNECDQQNEIYTPIGTECDNSGQVCCATPCITKYQGTCDSLDSLPGFNAISNTECNLQGKTCLTQKCNETEPKCPDGWTCTLGGNCVLAASGCEADGGIIVMPENNDSDGCPSGYIKDNDRSESLPENHLEAGKICCVKMDINTAKKTSTFFQGIGSDCMNKGNCSVEDIVNVAINVTKFLTGIIGSIALLFFIISGVMMIFSGGSEEKVTKAKTMMVQTIVGLFIFLGAYLIVSFVQDTLIPENTESIDYDKYKIKSTPPEMISNTTPACESDPVNWKCKEKFPNGGCRTFTSSTEGDAQGASCVKNLCPDNTNTICCDSNVSAGSPYSGSKKCKCDGTCEY